MKHTSFAYLLLFPFALTAMEEAPSVSIPLTDCAQITPAAKIMLHIIQHDQATDTGTVLCAYHAIYEQDDAGKPVFYKDKTWKKVEDGLEQVSAQVTSLDFEKNEVIMEISYSIPTEDKSKPAEDKSKPAEDKSNFKLEWAATKATMPIDDFGGSGYKELPRNNLYLRVNVAHALPKNIDTPAHQFGKD